MGSDRLAGDPVSSLIARRLSTAGPLGVGLLGVGLLGVGLLGVGLAGCGDPPPTSRNDGGPPPPTPVAVQNIAAYEGQQAFVTVLESGGDDWSSATVTPSTGGLEIVAQRCNATLCAVVARVPDTMRNTGQSIPAPIDAQRTFLVVESPTGDSQGLVSVFPTDALSAPGGETMVAGNYFAASVNAAAGSVLRAGGAEPIHWVVFGSAQIDVFDVSARDGSPGAGGHAGGAAGADGEGPGGGAAAYDMVGAGGGASFEDGGLGAMATEAAAAGDPGCAADFFATECGGSGGGGAMGEGGAGGGSVTLVVLGSACIRTVRGLGGDAASGSGGGGGGGALALVAASVFDCDPTAEVTGGAGDGDGGAGGEGHLFVGGREAPRIAFETSGLITSDPAYTLVGAGAPDQTIRIERVTDSGVEPVAEGTSSSDGSFSIPVELVAGINRLRLTQVSPDGSTMRAFNGNHVELERRDGVVRQLPIGGLLDVAYIP